MNREPHYCNWRCYNGYHHAEPYAPRFLKCGITECVLPEGHDGLHSDGKLEWPNPHDVERQP